MPEAERTGAEARDRAPWTERRRVDLGAVKRFEPIAAGIAKRNQPTHAPRVRKRLRFGRDVDAGRFEPGSELVQRGGVSDLPAEEACAFAHGAVDHDALLAVVHPEGQ